MSSKKTSDLANDLSRKTGQLEALLVVSGMDALDDLSGDVRANYLWLCSDLAIQIRSDFDAYHTLVTAQKGVNSESAGGAS